MISAKPATMSGKHFALGLVACVWLASVAGGCTDSVPDGGADTSQASDPLKEVMDQHLRAQHPEMRWDEAVWGAYSPRQYELLSSPELSRVKPHTRFYFTKLHSSYFEYPEVETLVSVEGEAAPYTVRDMLSPRFLDHSADFLDQFVGIEAGRGGREALANAIAELTRPTVYRGSIRNGRFDEGDTYQLELWSWDDRWRILFFEFSRTGTLRSIRMEKPSRRRRP